MIKKDDINLRKSVLHILDTVHGQQVLSDALLDPGPDLYDFIRTHIYRIFVSDDAKYGKFNKETSPVYKELATMNEKNEDSFLLASRAVARHLYNCMTEGQDIPAADLLFVSFSIERETCLAFLKLNYKELYTHDAPDGKTDIMKAHALFPASGVKIPEAVIIKLSDMSLRLMEKKYEINGEKIYYLSERFLVCNTIRSPKQKLSAINRTLNHICKKFDGNDFETQMNAKGILKKEFDENNGFDVDRIGQEIFGNSPEKKAMFDEKMEYYDMQSDSFSVQNDATVKCIEKQTLVTDNGIEISIPMNVYNKMGSFETERDVSGRLTIHIKNIEGIHMK